MTIVHLIFSFDVGGAETMLVDILEHQSQSCEIHLIIINNVASIDLLSTLNTTIVVHQIDRIPGSRNPLPILRLNLLLKRLSPDLVHMHDEKAAALLLSVFCGHIKQYLTVHGLNKSCRYLSRFNKLFTISQAVHDDLLIRCQAPSTIVFNGVDFSGIKRRTLGWRQTTPFKIVQVSRLHHEKKGQHLLMEAIALLKQRFRFHMEIEVTFVGEGTSKPFLEKLARNLDIEDHCIFAGLWSRHQVYRKLCEFDLLVQPSLSEGFGLTVIEGIAAGLPVLVSDEGGPAEIVKHGRYGWLFKNGTSTSLADALNTLLCESNSDMIESKINSAYGYAKERFDISRTAAKYLESY